MSQRRILVCDPISEKGIEFLKNSGLSVDVKLGLSEAKLVENAKLEFAAGQRQLASRMNGGPE